MVAVSKIPSVLEEEDLTLENLINTERAIDFFKRSSPAPALRWSDALFLSARDHCNQQKNKESPSVLLEVFEGDKLKGMMRPSVAIKKFAEAKGVELIYSTGRTVIDEVIDSLMDTANREILMSPFFQYSAVQTCEYANKKGVAIQNFAQ